MDQDILALEDAKDRIMPVVKDNPLIRYTLNRTTSKG
jgi:hypothetical protein